MAMISRAQEQQNVTPVQPSFQSVYAMLPEMAMMLRGAPTPENVPQWLKDQSWFTNLMGAPRASQAQANENFSR